MKAKIISVLILSIIFLNSCDNSSKISINESYAPMIGEEEIVITNDYIVVGNYIGKSSVAENSIYNIAITEVLKGTIATEITEMMPNYYSKDTFDDLLLENAEYMFFLKTSNNNDFLILSDAVMLDNMSGSYPLTTLPFTEIKLSAETTREEFIDFMKACIYEYTIRTEEEVGTPVCNISATYLFNNIDNFNIPEDKKVEFCGYTFLTDKYGRASVITNVAEFKSGTDPLPVDTYPFKNVSDVDFDKLEVGMTLAQIVELVEVPLSASESELLLEYKSDEGSFFTIYLNENLTFNSLVKH